MAVPLSNLCKYAKENYGMKLICGEENMNNLVNWVHMLEDPETASFLHGQELIFSTGIGHEDTKWFLSFAKRLVEVQASGLVLNIGPYIKSVPQDLIDFCKNAGFPLFSVPWETRIVDITNDFCRKIIKAEENEGSVAAAFRNAIFFPEKISEYKPLLERKEFRMDAHYCLLAMELKVPSRDRFSDFDKSVRMHLTKILYGHSDRFSIFRQDQILVVVLQDYSKKAVEDSIDRLQEICEFSYPGCNIRVGISNIDAGIESLSKNYKRAETLIEIATKQSKTRISYGELGLYKILLEVEDISVLKAFYDETLGLLEVYDKKNNTDLMYTLRCYLDNDSSVQEVAKVTFMHRNTINYKIKKIKEILESELDYKKGLELMLAFHIKELI